MVNVYSGECIPPFDFIVTIRYNTGNNDIIIIRDGPSGGLIRYIYIRYVCRGPFILVKYFFLCSIHAVGTAGDSLTTGENIVSSRDKHRTDTRLIRLKTTKKNS